MVRDKFNLYIPSLHGHCGTVEPWAHGAPRRVGRRARTAAEGHRNHRSAGLPSLDGVVCAARRHSAFHEMGANSARRGTALQPVVTSDPRRTRARPVYPLSAVVRRTGTVVAPCAGLEPATWHLTTAGKRLR